MYLFSRRRVIFFLPVLICVALLYISDRYFFGKEATKPSAVREAPVMSSVVLKLRNDLVPNFNDLAAKDTEVKVTVVPEKPQVPLPPCPDKSPHLTGARREDLENKTLEGLEYEFRNSEKYGASYSVLGPGGHFHPKDCTASQKVAILLPFRDRHHHLPILLNNLVPVLRRQLLDFRFFIIEQDPGVTFNRGLLFNIGFLTALARDKYDCIVFHDVDCLPLNDNILYKCGSSPRHLLAAGSKWNFGLSYSQFNGGAMLMSRQQYLKINGFSNLYFGWGSEDDDIRIRIFARGNNVVRYPKEIGRYYQLKHHRDKGNDENSVRFILVRQATLRISKEGLSTTVSKVRSVEEKPLFVWIRASVNMTQVLQTAPYINRESIKHLWEAAASFDKQGFGHPEIGDKAVIPTF